VVGCTIGSRRDVPRERKLVIGDNDDYDDTIIIIIIIIM
jgi:hypothetical protein